MHLENSISGSYSVVNVQTLCGLQLRFKQCRKSIHKCLHKSLIFSSDNSVLSVSMVLNIWSSIWFKHGIIYGENSNTVLCIQRKYGFPDDFGCKNRCKTDPVDLNHNSIIPKPVVSYYYFASFYWIFKVQKHLFKCEVWVNKQMFRLY